MVYCLCISILSLSCLSVSGLFALNLLFRYRHKKTAGEVKVGDRVEANQKRFLSHSLVILAVCDVATFCWYHMLIRHKAWICGIEKFSIVPPYRYTFIVHKVHWLIQTATLNVCKDDWWLILRISHCAEQAILCIAPSIQSTLLFRNHSLRHVESL